MGSTMQNTFGATSLPSSWNRLATHGGLANMFQDKSIDMSPKMIQIGVQEGIEPPRWYPLSWDWDDIWCTQSLLET